MGHLQQAHTRSAGEPETLRISFDTRAKVKIGPFSRGGVSRGQPAVRAADHDLHPTAVLRRRCSDGGAPTAVLVPAGILEVAANPLNILFGTSRDTSDFMADVLDWWWPDRRAVYPGVRRRRSLWTTAPRSPVRGRNS